MSATGHLSITIRNRQRTRRINTGLFRIIIATALEETGVTQCELCFHLVDGDEMSLINQQYLQHTGSTDVITFDHVESRPVNLNSTTCLYGEIFICADEAVSQSKQFGTTWQAELVRYAVHGILHLLGHDDLHPTARRTMKREENRLVRLLAATQTFNALAVARLKTG